MDIYVDIDGVIAKPDVEDTDGAFDYTQTSPIQENIERVNELYEDGHRIVYWTGRGTVTGEDWREVTHNQLQEWGCKFHELQMGKPPFDVFIDDKAYNDIPNELL